MTIEKATSNIMVNILLCYCYVSKYFKLISVLTLDLSWSNSSILYPIDPLCSCLVTIVVPSISYLQHNVKFAKKNNIMSTLKL